MFVMIILIFILTCLHLVYSYRKRQMSILKQFKINGPPPNVVFGNLSQLGNQQLFECRRKWTQEFGKVYGYYEGPTPVIVVSDLDVLREVFVKQFHNFNNRPIFPLQVDPKTDTSSHMFFARDDRWKRLRSLSSPIFSSYQIRKTYPLLQKIEENFVKQLDASGEEFDIYEHMQRLSFDVICEIIFGIKINNNETSRDTCRRVFRQSTYNAPKSAILTIFIPELHNFFRNMFNLSTKLLNGGDPVESLLNKVASIIEARKEKGKRRKDFLQAMLDAEKHEDLSSTSSTTSESSSSSASSRRNSTMSLDDFVLSSSTINDSNNNSTKQLKSPLTAEEVTSQCYLFLMAGYETSSNILAFSAYCLAMHREIQKKVFLELQEVLGDEVNNVDNVKVTYSCVQKLKYMDMVVHEVLRMYPVVSPLLSRECMQTTQINGHQFPAGAKVIADVWSVHYDSEIWGPEDPSLFCPERFEPSRHTIRHPMAFLAFGAGPKSCLGMRFALIEVKSVLAHILLRYDIIPGKGVQSSSMPRLHEGCTISPKDGVHVHLQPR